MTMRGLGCTRAHANRLPDGAGAVAVGIVGAVAMPHNLFLQVRPRPKGGGEGRLQRGALASLARALSARLLGALAQCSWLVASLLLRVLRVAALPHSDPQAPRACVCAHAKITGHADAHGDGLAYGRGSLIVGAGAREAGAVGTAVAGVCGPALPSCPPVLPSLRSLRAAADGQASELLLQPGPCAAAKPRRPVGTRRLSPQANAQARLAMLLRARLRVCAVQEGQWLHGTHLSTRSVCTRRSRRPSRSLRPFSSTRAFCWWRLPPLLPSGALHGYRPKQNENAQWPHLRT